MVSFFAALSASALALAAALTGSTADALAVGQYYRPTGASLVSGVPGNTVAPFRRTPCPALNALANHGYLPRNGKNITNAQLRDVVMEHFNLDLPLASLLVSVLPASFDLNLLGTHGLIEHDASLVHADAYLGADPSKINAALLKDVLSRADPTTKTLSVATMGQIRKERLATCVASNANCTFDATVNFLAFGEASLILRGFGDAATETVSLARACSFLEAERFPRDFTKPALITQADLGVTSAKIRAIATAP